MSYPLHDENMCVVQNKVPRTPPAQETIEIIPMKDVSIVWRRGFSCWESDDAINAELGDEATFTMRGEKYKGIVGEVLHANKELYLRNCRKV